MRSELLRDLVDPSGGPTDDETMAALRQVRSRHRRRRTLVGGGLAVMGAVATLVASTMISDGGYRIVDGEPASLATNTTPSAGTTASPTDAPEPFTYPAGCGSPSYGTEATVWDDVLAGRDVPSWTRSDPGRWLSDQVDGAGFGRPFDAGSAHVIAHGIDGVAYLWFGPLGDTGQLELTPLPQGPDGVLAARIEPTEPFDTGPYRPATVLTSPGGGVQLWLLIHPRDGWEADNFPGLTDGAPCLAADHEMATWLADIAATADLDPYGGTPPASPGRFAINSDVGVSGTDPGDRYLIDLAGEVLDTPLRQAVSGGVANLDRTGSGSRAIFTSVPPGETDPNLLAAGDATWTEPRTTAGGLDIRFILQDGPARLSPDELSDLTQIADGLNQDPFLGQPTPP